MSAKAPPARRAEVGTAPPPTTVLKRGVRLGKYRVQAKIGDGGFANVYRADDTVEGIPVALKIPHVGVVTGDLYEDLLREVRITAKLDHPHILPVKNAEVIDGRLVVAYPLGEMTLAQRMLRRLSIRQALDYGQQLLEALAYAHSQRVLHGDVKPDNLIIFADGIRLGDFGLAKVARHTVLSASGSGTVGYVAPEQAMGRPSLRSDCFSAGLIMYEMLSRHLPTWPYRWPPPGHASLRRNVHRSMVAFLRKAIEVDERRRFGSGQPMLAAFARARVTALGAATRRRSARRPGTDWRQIRLREFTRSFGRVLGLRLACRRCQAPVSEAMIACPWCGVGRRVLRDEPQFPRRCPRCRRGVKLDWKFCAWCYGAALGPQSARRYTDVRYVARCAACRGDLMAFMRYCPWCRRKVTRRWKFSENADYCPRCGTGVVSEFWRVCPWCARRLAARR